MRYILFLVCCLDKLLQVIQEIKINKMRVGIFVNIEQTKLQFRIKLLFTMHSILHIKIILVEECSTDKDAVVVIILRLT